MSDKSSIYDTITVKIIAAIEADAGKNVGTFKMPWHRSAGDPLHMPSNVVSKKHYGGNWSFEFFCDVKDVVIPKKPFKASFSHR